MTLLRAAVKSTKGDSPLSDLETSADQRPLSDQKVRSTVEHQPDQMKMNFSSLGKSLKEFLKGQALVTEATSAVGFPWVSLEALELDPRSNVSIDDLRNTALATATRAVRSHGGTSWRWLCGTDSLTNLTPLPLDSHDDLPWC
jgi:hypothetical protein